MAFLLIWTIFTMWQYVDIFMCEMEQIVLVTRQAHVGLLHHHTLLTGTKSFSKLFT